MSKFDGSSSAGLKDEVTAEVARAVERGFSELVAIFDRQLADLPPAEAVTRDHVNAAKDAAERGRLLSRELIANLSS